MATQSPPQQPLDTPRCITLTDLERQKSRYNPPNIQAALEALHQDGFVVLKDVVDVGHVEKINAHMCREADELVSKGVKPFNQGVNCASCDFYSVTHFHV